MHYDRRTFLRSAAALSLGASVPAAAMLLAPAPHPAVADPSPQVRRAGETPGLFGTAAAPTVGEQFTCSNGTWTNNPTSFAYLWQHSPDGTNWTTAAGSITITNTYTVATGDQGDYLRVRVTASNVAGGASQYSAATGQVAGPGGLAALPTASRAVR